MSSNQNFEKKQKNWKVKYIKLEVGNFREYVRSRNEAYWKIKALDRDQIWEEGGWGGAFHYSVKVTFASFQGCQKALE